MSYKPTKEQVAAMELAKTGQSFKMTAFAGAGKTSTLTFIANALNEQGKRGLYLSFNKAIAMEASTKMPPNVHCSTVHALALKSVAVNMKKKLSLGKPVLKDLAGILGLPSQFYMPSYLSREQDKLIDGKNPLDIALKTSGTIEQLYLDWKADKALYYQHFLMREFNSFSLINRLVHNIVLAFYNSGETNITSKLVDSVLHKECGISEKNNSEYIKEAKKQLFAWANILHFYNMDYSYDKKSNSFYPNGGKINTCIDPYSTYLKHWQLQNPIIDCDFILYDEAQDANGVMLAVLEAQMQAGVQVIFVGDPHQQIYAWRGAVNAMKQIDIHDSYLTQSFRFGNAIASYANGGLEALGETRILTSGRPDINDKVIRLESVHTLIKDDGDKNLILDGKLFHEWLTQWLRRNQEDITSKALVCRGNAFAFATSIALVEQEIPHYLDVDKKELKSIFFSIHKLMGNPTDYVLDDNMRLHSMFDFRSIKTPQDLENHLELNKGDEELNQYINLYEKHGIKKLIGILNNENHSGLHICTIHKSKGLEWETVIVSPDIVRQMINGFLPYLTGHSENLNIGEVYRLYYVASTRAKARLYVGEEFDVLLSVLRQTKMIYHSEHLPTEKQKIKLALVKAFYNAICRKKDDD